MARTLCAWFPDWSLRRSDAPPDRPVQVVGSDGRVTAADIRAHEAGVLTGMRRKEAEAICPTVITLDADPAAEAASFEAVAAAVETLVPRVEVASPGLLFVPIAGAVRYYGGEETLATRVVGEIETAAGPGGRVGIADGPFAARLAADRAIDDPLVIVDTPGFLAGLDVGVLDGEELADTLRWLGVTTLGELAKLPRGAIASRFGPGGLTAHRLAAGEDRPPIPREIPVDVIVEERFDPPLFDLEQAAFIARSLSDHLHDRLFPAGGLPHLVVVEAVAGDGETRSRTWRSPHPFTASELAERIRWQLRAWVESGGVPGGMTILRLIPGDLSDRGRQLALGQDAASEDEASRAIARARAIVGPDAVLTARQQGGRNPAEQVRWHRWGEDAPAAEHDLAAPWPGRLPGPAPVLVPPVPRPLEVEWDGGFPVRVRLGSRWEPVLSWAGPWRDTRRWWNGDAPADRYQVVTSAGAFLCEVREGRTWLAGVYD
ncbi:DNA polymerase Y family protein [bacterium]|nr:DNA polymerase Y family protein [bacterium]